MKKLSVHKELQKSPINLRVNLRFCVTLLNQNSFPCFLTQNRTIQVKNELGDTTEEIMPTLAQRWEERGEKRGVQKGIQKGRQEGMQKGIIDTCRNALREGSTPEYVAKITRLQLEKVLQIKKSL